MRLHFEQVFGMILDACYFLLRDIIYTLYIHEFLLVSYIFFLFPSPSSSCSLFVLMHRYTNNNDYILYIIYLHISLSLWVYECLCAYFVHPPNSIHFVVYFVISCLSFSVHTYNNIYVAIVYIYIHSCCLYSDYRHYYYFNSMATGEKSALNFWLLICV